MKKSIITAAVLLGLSATGAAIWLYTKPQAETMGDRPDKRGDRALPVNTVTVTATAVPITLDAMGTVEAEQSVAIRAEVSAVLQSIHFREGDMVKAGQLLFELDAGTQQAEMEKARANLARNQATWHEARKQAQRLESLAAKEYVTQQEYAQAQAQEQAARATVHADQATLKAAQLQLAHTRITAPLSGRAGILNVKPGNLVSAAATTPLVVINATQPVMVAFGIAQQHLLDIREQQRKAPLSVEVRREGKDAVLTTGTLAFIDNAVDTQTGTIRMKARIPNQDETIWPGELVALRLVLGVQQDALVIPETAVQPGQNGAFVYVVTDGKARMQPISVARQAGSQIIVGSGLERGQQVIINPPKSLRPDSAVQPIAAGANGTPPRAKENGKDEPRKQTQATTGGGAQP
jgi:multidrug efflux system membrane fusion protein